MSNGSIADNLSSKYNVPSTNIFETLRGYIEKNGGDTAGCHSISDLMYRLPEGGGGSGYEEEVSEEFVFGVGGVFPTSFTNTKNSSWALILEQVDNPSIYLPLAYTVPGGGGGGSGSTYRLYALRGMSLSPMQLAIYSDDGTITGVLYSDFHNATCRIRAVKVVKDG